MHSHHHHSAWVLGDQQAQGRPLVPRRHPRLLITLQVFNMPGFPDDSTMDSVNSRGIVVSRSINLIMPGEPKADKTDPDVDRSGETGRRKCLHLRPIM